LAFPDAMNAATMLPVALRRPSSPAVNARLCQGVICLPPIADNRQLHAILKTPIVPPVVSTPSTM
jgi:hypothetical protein